MRPRARDKKLQEEWAVPLQNIEDIYEVDFYFCLHAAIIGRMLIPVLWCLMLSLLFQMFKNFCLGKLRSNPWSELDGLQPETKIIDEQLGNINKKGFLTINSQPAVNGERSDSPTVGKS